MAVPSRVLSRLVSGLKKFQPILENAKTRDVNESDTVTILVDILQDVFGYDKYTDITSEHAIRGTFVDLAIKHDGKLILLIEVKAVNTDLKEALFKRRLIFWNASVFDNNFFISFSFVRSFVYSLIKDFFAKSAFSPSRQSRFITSVCKTF